MIIGLGVAEMLEGRWGGVFGKKILKFFLKVFLGIFGFSEQRTQEEHRACHFPCHIVFYKYSRAQ